MNMKNICLSVALLFLTQATFAEYYDLNLTAGHFQILIKNDTASDCSLNYTNLTSGENLTQAMSPTIRKGDHASILLFNFTQPIDYVISYRCRNKNITLNHHRNRSLFASGRVSGNVVTEKSDPGITAILEDSRRGSAFFGLNAYMVWSLNSTH